MMELAKAHQLWNFNELQAKIVQLAGFDTTDSFRTLYESFSRFAKRDFTMDYDDFTKFLQWAPDLLLNSQQRTEHYLRAFDVDFSNRITFAQFVLGLAASDSKTMHGGVAGDTRCRYIFRFYCRNRSPTAVMGTDDFRVLAKDIVLSKKPALVDTPGELERAAAEYFAYFETDFTADKFCAKVGSLTFRGTSCLFRSTGPVIDCLQKHLTKACTGPNQGCSSAVITENASAQTEIEFKFSESTLHVSGSGCVVERLSDLQGFGYDASGIFPETISQNTAEEIQKQAEAMETDNSDKGAIGCAGEMLRALDYFCRPYFLRKSSNGGSGGNNIQKAPFDWHEVKKCKVAACLIRLCRHLKPVFEAEPRCLELQQPLYVLGDLHGNYGDLHEFERLFWPMGPQNALANMLFLGDYVDRGIYGFEVIAYLFAIKTLAPKKVFLLRGNHELREQHKTFSFKAECEAKFEKDGPLVWETINQCFDSLPVAAIVDNKIFCVHGGIPHANFLPKVNDGESEGLVSIINRSCPSSAAYFPPASLGWELLWNDPAWNSETGPFDEEGFRVNRKRGTGHDFSTGALERFFDRFGLTHVIRAHQVQYAGFQIRYSAKLLTVFSSSSYSGHDNEAASALINSNEIHLIRVSSSQSKPGGEKENVSKNKQKVPESNSLSYKNVGAFAKR